jgi:membrane-bound metal-dependent hydrolase YbcI (DUF457 family)
MATPVGHYLVGLAVTELAARTPAERRRAPWWALLACAPDLDVLPGLAVGSLARFHHDASHSLAAAAVAALAVAAVVAHRRGRRYVALPALAFALYGSHLVLDGLTADPMEPVGMPLLWPFSRETFQAPWSLLPNVQHTTGPVVSVHNAMVMVREVLIFGPLVGLVLAVRSASVSRRATAAWLCAALSVTAAGLSIASLN